MADFTTLIKQAAVDAVSAGKPVAVCFGRVLSLAPLSLRLSQRLTLTGDFLVCTEGFAGKVSAGKIQMGDMVFLLQMQGGQKFMVVDKVVKE
ncbi:MAG: DUF2577 domain-containing protein [Oscillospiraceae bacterium]